MTNIVKEINGCQIEEKVNDRTGEKFYTLHIGDTWNIAHDLDRAINLAYIITR